MLAPLWLQGAVGFELTTLNISFILENRGVAETDDSSVMTEKQKDLTRADAHTIYLSSSNKGSVKEQDGSSSKTTGGETFTYRDNAQKMAIFWYTKWGETVPDLTNDNIYNKSDMW